MGDMHECDVWIAIDSDGRYQSANDEETVIQAYVDDVGETKALRLVRIVVKLETPDPSATVTPDDADMRDVTVDVPNDAGSIIDVDVSEDADDEAEA
jgi:hypothetical protein